MKFPATHKDSPSIGCSWANGCYHSRFGKQVTASSTSEREKVLRSTLEDLQLLQIQKVKIIQESRVRKEGRSDEESVTSKYISMNNELNNFYT